MITVTTIVNTVVNLGYSYVSLRSYAYIKGREAFNTEVAAVLINIFGVALLMLSKVQVSRDLMKEIRTFDSKQL